MTCGGHLAAGTELRGISQLCVDKRTTGVLHGPKSIEIRYTDPPDVILDQGTGWRGNDVEFRKLVVDSRGVSHLKGCK